MSVWLRCVGTLNGKSSIHAAHNATSAAVVSQVVLRLRPTVNEITAIGLATRTCDMNSCGAVVKKNLAISCMRFP